MIEYNLLSLFLVGWLGGVHCVGMCGGIVTAISLSTPNQPRSPWSILLGYNSGRITSYVIAGGIAGFIGSSALLLNDFFPVSRILYGIANLTLLLLGFYLAGWSQAILKIEHLGAGLWRHLQAPLKSVLPIHRPKQAFLAGLLWGWLPCGLVYSVLITALASGNAERGALAMLAFGLGTLPNLLLMGWFARSLRQWRQQRIVRVAAGILVASYGAWGLIHLGLNGWK